MYWMTSFIVGWMVGWSTGETRTSPARTGGVMPICDDFTVLATYWMAREAPMLLPSYDILILSSLYEMVIFPREEGHGGVV